MTDPFWAEVTRLMPDVDVVLLPSGEPAESSTSDSRFVAAIKARRVRDDTHDALRAVWSQLVPGSPVPKTYRRTWRAGSDGGQLIRVEVVATVSAGVQPGIREVLSAARAERLATGGPVDERRWVDADGLWLVTEVAEYLIELYGVQSPPTLTLTMLSPTVEVPAELGRQLVAGTSDEVPF